MMMSDMISLQASKGKVCSYFTAMQLHEPIIYQLLFAATQHQAPCVPKFKLMQYLSAVVDAETEIQKLQLFAMHMQWSMNKAYPIYHFTV